MAARLFTADECRMGRAALGWSDEDLAAAAAVSPGAVRAIEGAAGDPAAAARIEAAFAAAGVTFEASPDGRVVMRARTLDGIIEAPVTLSAGAKPRR